MTASDDMAVLFERSVFGETPGTDRYVLALQDAAGELDDIARAATHPATAPTVFAWLVEAGVLAPSRALCDCDYTSLYLTGDDSTSGHFHAAMNHRRASGLPDLTVDAEIGYWNGFPTQVRRVVGTVRSHDPDRDPPAAWWAGFDPPPFPGATIPPGEDLQGQRVDAIEVALDGVNFGGGIIYLDDRDGSGYNKVTEGRGSPLFGHRELPLVDVEPRKTGQP